VTRLSKRFALNNGTIQPLWLTMRFLPSSATPTAKLILITRGMRSAADGCISVLLPAYLLVLGFDALQVGLLTTATLLGSALLTLAVGFYGSRVGVRTLLLAASLLMLGTGIGFAAAPGFWPLLLIAFGGTLNPSAGDVSVFLPLEQTALSGAIADRDRTDLLARYSLVGSLLGAGGALLAIVPDHLAGLPGTDRITVYQLVFVAYAAVGLLAGLIYRRLPADPPVQRIKVTVPLGPSRGIVFRLAALFSVDAFAGGLVVQSLLALWLFQAFGLSVGETAKIFFATNLLSAISYLIAARIAARIGLINTMVFTHLPANVCLMIVPFVDDLGLAVALLLVRSLLSQMDVPTRTSYVMAVVTPAERPAAASVTAVPRSLASALGPTLGGLLLAASPFAWPLFFGGALKAAYDLTLLLMFRHVKPPEEQRFTAD
jgi:MFS family permease